MGKKVLDLNSYDLTNKIFNRNSHIDEIIKLYETDKSLLPMMVHENYANVINSQNNNEHEKMKVYVKCINSIIDGETFDDCISQQHDMEMKNGIKKLYWTENGIYVKHLPTMQFVKVNSLNMSLMPTGFIKVIFEYAIKILL